MIKTIRYSIMPILATILLSIAQAQQYAPFFTAELADQTLNFNAFDPNINIFQLTTEYTFPPIKKFNESDTITVNVTGANPNFM